MKKLFLLCAFCASVLAIYATVYNGNCGAEGDNITWSLNTEDSTLTITGSGQMAEYSYSTLPWIDYNSFVKTATISDGVTNICDWAFFRCKKMKNVTIPSSVTSIGNYAFHECYLLQSIQIHNGVTSIGQEVFYNCNNLTCITIPASVISIGEHAIDDCARLTAINVANDNPNYSSADGVLFNKNQTTLIQYPCGKEGAYNIPISVTSIEGYAFRGSDYLTGVTIPEGVASIGEAAFSYCYNLTSVTIPSSVISMADYAFHFCTGLTSVTCKSVIPLACDSHVFEYVDTTIPLYVPCGTKDAYEAADGWKEFGNIVEEPAPTMTLLSNNDSWGTATVTAQNCGAVTIEASPESGYNFVQWSDGVTTNQRNLTLTGDSTLTAEFAEAPKYYVAGNGSNGNPWCDEKYWVADGSLLVNGEITFNDVPAGAYEFKITNGKWHEAGGTEWAFGELDNTCSSDNILEGSNGNIKLVTTKTQDITIAFDGTHICVTGEFSNGVVITSYTIVGDYSLVGSGWETDDTNNDMTETSPGVFTLVKTNRSLSATPYGYKVVGNHSYSAFEYPASGNNSITIPEAGNYDVTFTFTPATSTLTADAVKSTPAALDEINASNTQTLKLLKDGQFYILRDGEIFNAQGARVE